MARAELAVGMPLAPSPRARGIAPEGRARLLLLLPALCFLLLVFAYPLGLIVVRSVTDPEPGIGHYIQIATAEVYLRVLSSTFGLALTVTLVTLALGYPVAYALARSRGAVQAMLVMLVLLPFWTSLLVRTYAWMVILGRYGIVNQALMALGLTQEPVRLLHTALATHIGMIHVLLPFMILPIWSVMARMDPALLMAARSLGAAPLRAFLRVFFPLTLPGVFAGSLLVFILALGFYITPALLGGPSDLTLSMLIAQQVSELLAWGLASALAVTLLVATLAVIVVASRLLGLDKIWEGLK
jgi:ABC-type spermidine/putrescine transport system permease subunit I